VAVLAACDDRPRSPVRSIPTLATVTVFAAASTADALREAGRLFEAMSGAKVAYSFDSSSTLARQIMAGAPADVFVSADQAWMDEVEASGMIQPTSRENLLGNELVLIVPTASGTESSGHDSMDLAVFWPRINRLALADPSHVPAGRYARQSLESLGWWDSVSARLITAPNARAALRLVEMGAADAGIVYASDARASPAVRVVATFPSRSHEPVTYPVALCRNAAPHAAEFLKFLRSPESVRIFESAGFRVLPSSEPLEPGRR